MKERRWCPGARTGKMIARGAAVFSLCSLAAVLVLSALFWADRRNAVVDAEASLSRDAAIVALRLDGTIRAATMLMDDIARTPSHRSDSAFLSSFMPWIPEMADILLFDSAGICVASAFPRDRIGPASELMPVLFGRLQSGAPIETGMVLASAAWGRSLAVAKRLETPDGSFDGVVAALLEDSVLISILDSDASKFIDSVRLLDRSGGELLSASRFQPAGDAADRASPEITEPGTLSGFSQLRSAPLHVEVSWDSEAALSRWSRTFLVAVGTCAAFSVLLAAVSFSASAFHRAAERSDRLREELKRREALFREVNHRVKNDLQMVSSVLSLGMSHASSDSASRDVLAAAQSRIGSISLVHEQLYRQAALAANDLGSYMAGLASYLKRAYAADRPLSVRAESEPGLRISMDAAVSCGLMLNELATNAFKYAFPDGRPGTILFSAKRTTSGGIDLSVSDDGIGFSSDESKSKESSFGLTLVETLAGQLGADLCVESGEGKGTSWRIQLPRSVADSSPEEQGL